MRCHRVQMFMITLLLSMAAGVVSQSSEPQADYNHHVTVILDVSGSMKQQGKFESVKNYLEHEVFGKVVGTGDYFTLITFGDDAGAVISQQLSTDTDLIMIKDKVRSLAAEDSYTDIGVALEMLFATLSARNRAPEKDIILFVTDGKNAPPSSSPYYGKDIAMDSRFKDIGRKISLNGWFLYVIGIGDQTDAQKIAEAVEGSVYRQTDSNMTGIEVEEYIETIDGLKSRIAGVGSGNAPAGSENSTLSMDKSESSPRPDSAESIRRNKYSGTIIALAAALGIPYRLLLTTLLVLIILVLAAILFIVHKLTNKVEVKITDNLMGSNNALTRTLSIGSGLLLNSEEDAIPSIGDEHRGILSLERSMFGLRLRINDGTAFSPDSRYHAKGVYVFKGGEIELANGNRLSITVKR